METPHIKPVRDYLLELQDRICDALEEADGTATFDRLEIPKPGGALSRPRVLEGGAVLERSAVNFSHTLGPSLPPAATVRRPELAGRGYEAASVSLITHPRNPYAPTSHANVRCFFATAEGEEPIWWFGGGFDLTPYYGFDDDARHWHRNAAEACEVAGPGVYAETKQACDEYFYLKHRGEARGIGGLFFDDWNRGGFDASFAFMRSVADHYLPGYLPILERRKDHGYGEAQRQWQCIRRGRYVEFNLIYDRGTLFGLQSGGRVESILGSMPPEVRWSHDAAPAPGSEEERLMTEFLPPRDWLSG